MERDDLLKEYEEAVAEERVAWEQARGKHTGSANPDPQTWAVWVAAAERVKQLSQKLKRLKP